MPLVPLSRHQSEWAAQLASRPEPPNSRSSRTGTTERDEPEDIGEVDRQLKEALRDCDELLVRANRVLLRDKIDQDNDPPDNPLK